jgi:hypothetical protein
MTAFQAQRRHGDMISIDRFAAADDRRSNRIPGACAARLKRCVKDLNQIPNLSGFVPGKQRHRQNPPCHE